MVYKVVCVTRDPTGPDDCRCITEIGFKYDFRSLRMSKKPEKIYDDITEKNVEYYLEFQGTKIDLLPAERNGTKYVRTEQTDTEDDKLLQLDDCESVF
jgi:hypothetical protein